jgi:hypothetical protein
MELFDELNEELNDLDGFQKFIAQKKEEDTQFLRRTFWHRGKQVTVLNYLILAHDAEEKDLRSHIELILHEGADIYSSQPLHLALERKKIDLFKILLTAIDALRSFVNYKQEPKKSGNDHGSIEDEIEMEVRSTPTKQFDLNARDEDGQTLIARAIQSRDIDALNLLLQREPNVDQVSKELQPIHLAVSLDYAEAVHALIGANADVNNPCLMEKETPLLLAAHYGKEKALEALLQRVTVEPGKFNVLDSVTNIDKLRAIDLLCARLQDQKAPATAIRCIAMLLCQGASAPRSDEFRKLLRDNHMALLDAVIVYAKKEPQLGLQFARAVLDKRNPLHDIIYADRTLMTSIRHFFGITRGVGYKLAKLVLDAYQNSDDLLQKESDELKFAHFVNRYEQAISARRVYNRYSGMLWKIDLGHVVSWRDADDYAKSVSNEHTRSAQIAQEMDHDGKKVPLHSILSSSEDDEHNEDVEESTTTLR